MTLDSLIAILALVLAAYSIMPRHRQLDLLLRLRRRDWLAIVITLLLTHYLLFFDFFRQIGLTPRLALYHYGITPGSMAYLVLIVLGLGLGLEIHFFRLSPKRLGRFKELVEALLWSNHHRELIDLLERHLPQLVRISKDPFLISRLRQRLTPDPPYDLRIEHEPGSGISFPKLTAVRRQPSKAVALLLRFLPDHGPDARVASEVLQRLLTSPSLATSIAKSQPYFGLTLLTLQTHDVLTFLDLYLSALIRSRGSVWYLELRDNTNVGVKSRYAVPERNRLLHFFLADATVAERLAVYKPVGDLLLSELDSLARRGSDDEYNWAVDDFERWTSPLWTGIFFFDVMVSSALHQNIQWHMWLYYYPSITNKIVNNYRLDDPGADPVAEFPNRYSLLIYEMLDAMRNWIRAVEHLPPDQENIKLKSLDAIHENGNIPKSAILAFGQCCREVVLADRVPDQFKLYTIGLGIDLYFELRSTERGGDFAKVLAKSLRTGGGGWLRTEEDHRYQCYLREAFARHDVKIRHLEYREELQSAIEAKGR